MLIMYYIADIDICCVTSMTANLSQDTKYCQFDVLIKKYILFIVQVCNYCK